MFAEEIIREAREDFKGTPSISDKNSIPDTEKKYHMQEWYKIPDIICVYVDIRNSTGMSVMLQSKSAAKIYEYFVDTAVRLFHGFDAEYIDIKGDWVFALFSRWRHFRALAAAVTFKTFCDLEFIPWAKKKYNDALDIWVHIWIDQKTLLVKQIWIRNNDSRDRRKNEVWAWKTINMASKLASKSKDNGMLISERFYEKIKNEEIAVMSCWCLEWIPSKTKTSLWEAINLEESGIFDFKTWWLLKNHWCDNHGQEYCSKLLDLDKQ